MAIIDGLSQLIFNFYEAFTVAFYVKENDRLNCISSMTFAKSFDKHKSIPIEGTLPGWVMKHNEALIIPNFDRDADALGYYGADEGIKSFMGYPMEAHGVIVVDSKRKYVFTDKEKKHLGSIVSMIHEELEREKKSVERDEALEELYAEKRILGLFNELNLSKISLLEILGEMLHISGGNFCFIGMEKRGKLCIQDVVGPGEYEEIKKECHPGESIASMVIEGGREMLLPHSSGYLRGKPLFFPGEPLKARQFFGFPLIADDVPFGVIGFVALHEPHLRESAIVTLRNLSSLLALYYTSLWMKENAERLKDFDPITGAIQFSAFLALIEKMAKKQDRFSLVSVKLLNVSTYNRKIGVESTNNIIRKVFQIVKYYAGGQSFIARKGGGHFYIALKGSQTFETRNMVKLLQHAISKSLSEERLSLSARDMIELDIASFPEDTEDLWNLFEKKEEKKPKKFSD
jgi:GGDEF domain-containing protein